MHCAAYKGKAAMVPRLAEMKATIDARDNQGRTPLELAQGQGHSDVVEVLQQLLKQQRAAGPEVGAAAHEVNIAYL